MEVGLGLLEEVLALGPGDGRQGSLLDGGGAIPEPSDHGVDVERVTHGSTVEDVDGPAAVRFGGAQAAGSSLGVAGSAAEVSSGTAGSRAGPSDAGSSATGGGSASTAASSGAG
jgi:hypothetical protein